MKSIRMVVLAICLAGLCSVGLAQAPQRAGEALPIVIDSSGPSDVTGFSTGSSQVFRLSHPGATYIALRFSRFDLAPGQKLIVSDANGGQSYTLTGKGKLDLGAFWAQHVKGDTIVLEYFANEAHQSDSAPAAGFRVDEFAAGFVDLGYQLPSDPVDPGTEAICGADDKQHAVCYQNSHPTEYDKSRAVARLLINGLSLCTGWLASADNHLVTNEHCVTTNTDASNTDVEFMAEAPTCGSSNCQLCWAGQIFSGGILIQDNPALDYALMQITVGDPASIYGFLEIDDRAAVIGEEIYIPQHPGGFAKQLGIDSSDAQDGGTCHVNTFSPGCSSSSYQDVGYQCDTAGGSSGSPVIARSSHKVIALHHCANCPNRGVPIDLVCDEICPLLGPACTVNADCDDSDPCTDDTCTGGSCSNDPLSECCGNGSCETGEDCNTCSADCPSGTSSGAVCGNGICEAGDGEDCVSCPSDCNGKQNGKPSNRFCCGDGDGENPVSCSDSTCTSSGFQCTDVPAGGGSYCCGDGVCDPGEDASSCEIDCGCGNGTCDAGEDACSCGVDCGAPPPENCSDGVDNDCDGLIDSSDPDCPSCGGKNALCSSGSDCCSGRCKANGRCR